MPGPLPKPNAQRMAPMAFRRNAEISPHITAGHYDAECAAFVIRQTDRLRAPARRWARAVLATPQAQMFTNSEIALVEVGALILDRWIREPQRKSAELAEWGRLNDRLLTTHAARLRAHIEIEADIADAALDELAVKRRSVRERLV